MKKKSKLISGIRKTAKATAHIKTGSGKVRINLVPIEIFTPLSARERILTPLDLADDLRNKIDIDVRVNGGGFMGQADASAIAISKAMDTWFKNKDLKKRLISYDKHLLSGDARRKEPKKVGGTGARKKKQKSYR